MEKITKEFAARVKNTLKRCAGTGSCKQCPYSAGRFSCRLTDLLKDALRLIDYCELIFDVTYTDSDKKSQTSD